MIRGFLPGSVLVAAAAVVATGLTAEAAASNYVSAYAGSACYTSPGSLLQVGNNGDLGIGTPAVSCSYAVDGTIQTSAAVTIADHSLRSLGADWRVINGQGVIVSEGTLCNSGSVGLTLDAVRVDLILSWLEKPWDCRGQSTAGNINVTLS